MSEFITAEEFKKHNQVQNTVFSYQLSGLDICVRSLLLSFVLEKGVNEHDEIINRAKFIQFQIEAMKTSVLQSEAIEKEYQSIFEQYPDNMIKTLEGLIDIANKNKFEDNQGKE